MAALVGPAGSQEVYSDEAPYTSAVQRAAGIRSEVCSVCHGARGISKWTFVPNLAGQDKDYLINQLTGLRARKRADHYAQAAMWGHAANLKDDEIESLADFYSNLEPSKGDPGDPNQIALGRKVFERYEIGRPACATCHFGGRGNRDLPRLAGQHADYEARALREFHAGFRVNGTMSFMAAKLTLPEINAAAAYAASLNVPAEAAQAVSNSSQTVEAPSAERGRSVFRNVGCFQCHGEDGKGGVGNPNSQGGMVPALTLVSQGYSDSELKDKIRLGVRYVGKAAANGPTPPLFMPTWGRMLTNQQLDDLVAYLKSLAAGKNSQDF
ncbi:MAG: c-type cytochrome [Elusimicrobia bacterium]|nr:c-type cytochrome [Elusimicrobiota bacterium]